MRFCAIRHLLCLSFIAKKERHLVVYDPPQSHHFVDDFCLCSNYPSASLSVFQDKRRSQMLHHSLWVESRFSSAL